MKREVTIELSARHILKTGFRCDISQVNIINLFEKICMYIKGH